MSDPALAVVFVLLAWWLSTGTVMVLNGLRRATFRRTLIGASALALVGLYGLHWSSQHQSGLAAYLAFCCALVVWAWHELSFLLGFVTGSRREPCPPGAVGWQRFTLATAAVIHHEVALALTQLAMVGLTWGAPNQVGTWTFLLLWIMRLSAKFNLFLGVRNITEEFIPTHLRYLVSYFRRARINPLMPVSVLSASAVVVHLAIEASADGATGFVLVGRTLLATLLGLAVLEHVFLAFPMPDALLWRWAIRPGHGDAIGERLTAVGDGQKQKLRDVGGPP
jgi:putative photosynthetic complex assembly protein 2